MTLNLAQNPARNPARNLNTLTKTKSADGTADPGQGVEVASGIARGVMSWVKGHVIPGLLKLKN